MKRRLFTSVSGLSLILCFALFWVRSYWILEAWTWNRTDIDTSVELLRDGAIGRGEIDFQYQRDAWNKQEMGRDFQLTPLPSEQRGFHWCGGHPVGTWQPHGRFKKFQLLGFSYEHKDRSNPTAARAYLHVGVSFWALALLTSFLPAVWLFHEHRRRMRNRREQFGLCLRCGYDLRASHDRCPECGEAILSFSSPGTPGEAG
jgi:hypothetical protein